MRLFRYLSQVRLAVLPARPPGIAWQPRDLYASCPRNLGRLRHKPYRATCNPCARHHLVCAFKATSLGHRFQGACGTHTFLMPLPEANGAMGVAAVREAGRRAGSDDASVDGSDGAEEAGTVQFHQAVLLLRALAGCAKLRMELEQRRADLARMDRLLAYHEGEAEKLRATLNRAIPSLYRAPSQRIEGSRTRELIRVLLDQLNREFSRPLMLSQLARERGMNASYLSSLFTREVGVPFKSYLTALRLQHAQELLSNPRRRVSDIALEVGYASADRFRAAFRRWTGVPASEWREIQRMR